LSDKEVLMAEGQRLRVCPRKCPHNHHNGHKVGELALYGLGDLVPWSDEGQQVDLYDHTHVDLEY
jgi:hypothetical protein